MYKYRCIYKYKDKCYLTLPRFILIVNLSECVFVLFVLSTAPVGLYGRFCPTVCFNVYGWDDNKVLLEV